MSATGAALEREEAGEMGNKLAVVLSGTALLVALLGSTSAGQAALNAVMPVPLAKRAYLADTAKNAVRVDSLKASRIATPGMLVPLDSSGKFPASVGAVGPKGDPGPKGNDGATHVVVRESDPFTSNGDAYVNVVANCASGEVAVGGGGGETLDTGAGGVTLIDSKPYHNTVGGTPTGWFANLHIAKGSTGAAYAICVKP